MNCALSEYCKNYYPATPCISCESMSAEKIYAMLVEMVINSQLFALTLEHRMYVNEYLCCAEYFR